MLKFDCTSTLYSNYLNVINPVKHPLDNVPDKVEVYYDSSGNRKSKFITSLNVFVSSSITINDPRDVEVTSKVEAAFHCLVSKICNDYPHLKNENFYKMGQQIQGNDDATIVIKEIFKVLRIIRNKFHHDKLGGLSWDDKNNLIITGEEEIIISEQGVKVCVYIVWYFFKNNMKYLYNRITLNYLYAALHSQVKKISYGYKNKKNNKLLKIENPWRVNTHYMNRNVVTGEIVKEVKGGYEVFRLRCFNSFFNSEFGEQKLIESCYRRLDYQFKINDIEYLIPDEYFLNYKDGEEAFISGEDIEKFIYHPLEIANF